MAKDTKEKILLVSLELFSKDGYDAVSIRTIADMVGVRNSALYKHYKSKQEIFDAIVERCKTQFMEKSREILTKTRKIEAEEPEEGIKKYLDQVKNTCLAMYVFQTEDDMIVKFRRILMMEQFKNPKMEEIYRSFFIDMPINSQAFLFKELMKEGYMKQRNPEVLAMELYAPFFLYHQETGNKEERMILFRTHLDYFFETNLEEMK